MPVIAHPSQRRPARVIGARVIGARVYCCASVYARLTGSSSQLAGSSSQEAARRKQLAGSSSRHGTREADDVHGRSDEQMGMRAQHPKHTTQRVQLCRHARGGRAFRTVGHTTFPAFWK